MKNNTTQSQTRRQPSSCAPAAEIFAADLFCGAGGTSTGLLLASEELGLRTKLLAINHWEVAIASHTRNHPDVEHRCETVDGADPRKIVPGGRLHLLVASPECTHHSNARGGKPMSDQSRATAWHVLRWAEALVIDNILIENVREFREWGPLHDDCICGMGVDVPAEQHKSPCRFRKPIIAKRGALYRQFLSSLRALGYTVSERVLNAADYGDATTRYRLFIQARKGHRPVWPAPTHLPPDKISNGLDIFAAQPWRPAREVIDWKKPSKSIYGRKKPLADATMARIMAGLRKYSGLPFLIPSYQEREGQAPRVHDLDKPLPTVTAQGWQGLVEPYVVNMKGKSDASDIDKPLPTQTTKQHMYLAQPFLVVLRRNADAKDIDRPMPTLTADGNHVGVAEPFIVTAGGPIGPGRNPHSVNEPLGAILTDDHRALVEPFVMSIAHRGAGSIPVRSADTPLYTITTEQEMAVVEPFVVVNRTHADAHSVDEPLRTLTTGGNMGVVEPFVIPVTHSGGENRSHDVDDPLPTVTGAHPLGTVTTTSRGIGLAEPFLVTYNGNGVPASVDEPLDTVTGRDRFALISPEFVHLLDKDTHVVGYLDIGFRMLQPDELAAAMGFPEGYVFEGTREDRVKQIGNAVPVNLAKALCKAILESRA